MRSEEPNDAELKMLAKELAQAFKDSGSDINSLIAFFEEYSKKLTKEINDKGEK
jgi:hypothetical protein